VTAASLSSVSCFVLLDDAGSDQSIEYKPSRLYTGFIERIDCTDVSQLTSFFEDVQQKLSAGVAVVGLFNYELGAAIHNISERADAAPVLASALVFAHCQNLSCDEVDIWIAKQLTAAHGEDFYVEQIVAGKDASEFRSAIEAIHRYIEAGDTYQVNLTFPLHLTVHGNPVALYAALRRQQPVPYGALMVLPDGQSVLSLSPELFVSHAHGRLLAKPMKGTLEADADHHDTDRATALAASTKNRAENLMIVDLLRNDLGRIAQTGTVKVPALFEVERFGHVWQMTSTIEAECRPDVTLADIFSAIYPCGSITGAPKRRTMQILRELETEERGLYTGAIGWFDPPKAGRALSDFMLSVPIRTLMLDAPAGNDVRQGVMRVGAGIVYDSDADSEYAECLLKARFLTGLSSQFSLIETLQAHRTFGARNLNLHLQRLSASARHFGFRCDPEQIAAQVSGVCADLASDTLHRMRLLLNADGTVDIRTAPMSDALPLPVRLLLAKQPMQSHDVFLRHKTTLRRRYDLAWQAAEKNGAFDTLFINEKLQVTEGGRSNLFMWRDGQWLTPPLSEGVLPGIMRGLLLDDPTMNAREAVLTLDDLRSAERIMVCSSLRGSLPATVDWDAALVDVT
jgi:para-aminobenzoate synthetase / 4-amino-4-deoxychorismate lyase